MGRRGPQPIDFGLLLFWEFEFYKSFHLLRDGTPLPPRYASPRLGLTPQEIRTFIDQLKRMTGDQYWLTTRYVAAKLGQKLNLSRPSTAMDRLWAEQERLTEIIELERALK